MEAGYTKFFPFVVPVIFSPLSVYSFISGKEALQASNSFLSLVNLWGQERSQCSSAKAAFNPLLQ
jgi:hypothetical protein